MKELTTRQNRIYRKILDYMYEFKSLPTYDYLRRWFGYKSNNTIQDHLKALEKKGYITLQHGQSRGIVITDQTTCAYCRRGD